MSTKTSANRRSAPAGKAATKFAQPERAGVVAAVDETSKATTLRLDPMARAGLEILRRATGSTLNKLVNDAVLMYVSTRSAQLDAMLRASLARIEAYRHSDPYFEQSVAASVAAEAAHAGSDPTEGRMVVAKPRPSAAVDKPRARRRRR